MNEVTDRQRAVSRVPSITNVGDAAGGRATGGFRYLDLAERGRKEKCPRSVAVRTSMPLSAAGKVLKTTLRAEHTAKVGA